MATLMQAARILQNVHVQARHRDEEHDEGYRHGKATPKGTIDPNDEGRQSKQFLY